MFQYSANSCTSLSLINSLLCWNTDDSASHHSMWGKISGPWTRGKWGNPVPRSLSAPLSSHSQLFSTKSPSMHARIQKSQPVQPSSSHNTHIKLLLDHLSVLELLTTIYPKEGMTQWRGPSRTWIGKGNSRILVKRIAKKGYYKLHSWRTSITMLSGVQYPWKRTSLVWTWGYYCLRAIIMTYKTLKLWMPNKVMQYSNVYF